MAASNTPALTRTILLTGTVAQYGPVTAAGAPATAAGNVFGFAQVAGVSGEVVPIVTLGTTLATADGVIALGALIEVDTTVSKVTTRSAGVSIGRALQAAAADNDVIEVSIIPN